MIPGGGVMRKIVIFMIVFLSAISFNIAFAKDFVSTECIDDGNGKTISFEWYNDKRGKYTVSFPAALQEDNDVLIKVNNSKKIRIADITKTYAMCFDEGLNKVELFSAGRISAEHIRLEYITDIADTSVHIESNEFTFVSGENFYNDNYGSDLSNGDIDVFRQWFTSPEVHYAIYAPIGGEYTLEAAMSQLGVDFTSDIEININGAKYEMTTDKVTLVSHLINAKDPLLYKRYRYNATVTLNEGINYVIVKAIEPVINSSQYLFHIDCIDFDFTEETVEVKTGQSEMSTKEYTAEFNGSSSYYVEFVMQSFNPMETDIAKAGFSADGSEFTILSKGTLANSYSDSNIEIVDEWVEDGVVYGRYRLKDILFSGGKFFVRTYEDKVYIEKLVFVPVIDELYDVKVNAEKSILLPFEETNIKIFAKNSDGGTINTNLLRQTDMFTFRSSDSNIIDVDANGSVKAKNSGMAYVDVTVGENVFRLKFTVYTESRGFTFCDAYKEGGMVKIKLLAPVRSVDTSYIMYIAEYEDNTLTNIKGEKINGLGGGQVTFYSVPHFGGAVKIISLKGIDDLAPMMEVIEIK